jgi:hypothetical protein
MNQPPQAIVEEVSAPPGADVSGHWISPNVGVVPIGLRPCRLGSQHMRQIRVSWPDCQRVEFPGFARAVQVSKGAFDSQPPVLKATRVWERDAEFRCFPPGLWTDHV